MPIFDCLYFLENIDLYILEIKRKDVPSDTVAAEKYKWLKINKETLEISLLTFCSMDSAGEIEERFFEEGYLKFNLADATFIEKYNSAQYPLNRRMDWKITTALNNQIEYFIHQLK